MSRSQEWVLVESATCGACGRESPGVRDIRTQEVALYPVEITYDDLIASMVDGCAKCGGNVRALITGVESDG